MVRSVQSLVRRRPVATAFLVLFLAFSLGFLYDQRLSDERVRQRRESDRVVCMFLNDTRAELRGILRDSSGANTGTAPSSVVLPPDLQRYVDEQRAASRARIKEQEQRLADYDCDAFIRGDIPNRDAGAP